MKTLNWKGIFALWSVVLLTITMTAVPQAQAEPVVCQECSDGVTTGEEEFLAMSLLPPTVPLAEAFRTQLCGDYVAAGVGLRSSASGTINISLPAGATIQKAFLYWSIMQSGTPSPALFNVTFNGNPVVGALVGTAGDPCWSPDRIHNFAADVTALAVNGANSMTLAAIVGILREGASLVVIFNDPASSVVREVIIRDGAVTFALPPAESTTFSGFSATSAVAKTTWIVADGQKNQGLNNRIFDDLGEVANHTLRGDDPGANLYWDTRTDLVLDASDGSVTLAIESNSDTGTFDCLTWVAQVLSVEVESELKIGDAVADIPRRGLAPYDQIILYVPVKVSSSVASQVVLTFKLGPSAIVSGIWDGRSYSDEPLFEVHSDDKQQTVSPGFSGDLSVRIDIKGTDSDAIMDHIVDYGASGALLDDGLTVDAKLDVGGGGSTDTFDVDIKNKETNAVAHIVYPSFDNIVGDPPSNGEVDGFYTRGDTNYHHGLHSLVRKYALEASRFGGERIPESPSAAASSIADYVTAVLKPKGDPDVYVAPDTKITEWVEDGLLGIGMPYLPTPYVKGHICIEHAYLFSSLSRTIGLPTREVTVALGTDLFQVWNVVLDVTFGYQEAATQVWHDGQWNYYDMYIYGTGIRDIAEYLKRWPVVRAWYAFDRQYMHSFAIQTGNGEASDSAHWSHLADEHKAGLIIIAYSPVTMDLVDSGGRVIADKFSEFTDPVPSVNPSTQIPGAFHRLPEAVGFTDSADPSTSVELPEMIFVPDDAGRAIIAHLT